MSLRGSDLMRYFTGEQTHRPTGRPVLFRATRPHAASASRPQAAGAGARPPQPPSRSCLKRARGFAHNSVLTHFARLGAGKLYTYVGSPPAPPRPGPPDPPLAWPLPSRAFVPSRRAAPRPPAPLPSRPYFISAVLIGGGLEYFGWMGSQNKAPSLY